MKGFIDFIRERGVIGLAVAFIIGGAITQLVASLVTDIVNPTLGIFLSRTKSLETMSLNLWGSKILWGHFVSVTINFLIVSFVVYLIFRVLGLE